jgi:hypothetical protein
MDATLKKGVGLLLLVFIGYYLFTDPSGAAGAAKDVFGAVWDGMKNLFAAMIRFLDALFA